MEKLISAIAASGSSFLKKAAGAAKKKAEQKVINKVVEKTGKAVDKVLNPKVGDKK